ncbi:hypothetical protein [Kitasatospora sp. NPDC091207]|uniref:hypothetical protein n=1 Tax=Kitasatospora sp. NPDC091207 TaxID=3364083 RepID=UPI00382CCD05
MAAVVIADGLFARHVRPQVPCACSDVFVDLPADLRPAREIQRKSVRDGSPLDVLPRNYLNHRGDAHERHVEPLRHGSGTVVDGALDPDILARQVWSATAEGKPNHNA